MTFIADHWPQTAIIWGGVAIVVGLLWGAFCRVGRGWED